MSTMKIVIKSAFIQALFLFFSINISLSLPLTETVYTIPHGELEIALGSRIAHRANNARIDSVSLGIAGNSDFSFWIDFSQFTEDEYNFKNTRMSDTFITLWYYWFNGWNSRFHCGFLTQFRIPSGPDIVDEPEYAGLSLGRHEIKWGLVAQLDISPIHLHGNLFYVFRQNQGDSFYARFRLHPFKTETYTRILGLNPFYDDTFLAGNQLKNDYLIFSLAVNTEYFYPLIPFGEIYYSNMPYQGEIEDSTLPIEAGKYNPLYYSLGLRYFISRDFYCGVYSIQTVPRYDDFISSYYGIECALQF